MFYRQLFSLVNISIFNLYNISNFFTFVSKEFKLITFFYFYSASRKHGISCLCCLGSLWEGEKKSWTMVCCEHTMYSTCVYLQRGLKDSFCMGNPIQELVLWILEYLDCILTTRTEARSCSQTFNRNDTSLKKSIKST